MARQARVKVIATGGTIAMRKDPATGGAIPAVTGADLVAAVPGLAELALIAVEEFTNIPSEWMRPELWLQLARRVRQVISSVDGVVVLHGTDTMEETAFYLDVTLPTTTPVVLTGAQRAASDPDPDGPRNILDAVAVAINARSRGRGVMVVMGGEIHAARRATKADTEDVDAFDSAVPPEMGRIRARRIRFTRPAPPRVHVPFPTTVPRVDIIPMYAGADDVALKAALDRGAAGLVIEAVGAGNVSEELYRGIVQALDSGIPVVVSSRVWHGEVRPLYSYPGGGVSLVDAGAILAHDLRPPKARVLLIAALGAGLQGHAVAALFESSERRSAG
jgi:L-asparaginase